MERSEISHGFILPWVRRGRASGSCGAQAEGCLCPTKIHRSDARIAGPDHPLAEVPQKAALAVVGLSEFFDLGDECLPHRLRVPGCLGRAVVVLSECEMRRCGCTGEGERERVAILRDVRFSRERTVVRELQQLLGNDFQHLALVLIGLSLPHATPGCLAARDPVGADFGAEPQLPQVLRFGQHGPDTRRGRMNVYRCHRHMIRHGNSIPLRIPDLIDDVSAATDPALAVSRQILPCQCGK